MTDATLADFYALWPLYESAVVASAVIGLVLGVVGVYIVLRRLVFLSAAVSQLASFGVALTFFLGHALADPAWLPAPTVGAVIVAFAAIGVVAGGRGRSGVWRDSVLGALFLVGAAGTLALGTRILEDIADIDSLLFGSAVAVTADDLALTAWVFGGVLIIHALWWRGFAAVSFDPAGASVRGIPTRAFEIALFLTFALTLSIGTRVIGALPVFALSVLPAVAGARLALNLPMALAFSGIIGGLAGVYGYLVAFFLDLPVGPAQVLVAAAFAALAEAARAVSTLSAPAPHGGRDRARTMWPAWWWRAPGVAAAVLGALLLGRPVLAGVAVAFDVDPALATLTDAAIVLAAVAAAIGAALCVRGPLRAWLPRWAIVVAWSVLAYVAPVDEAMVRPTLAAFGALATARAFRQAHGLVSR